MADATFAAAMQSTLVPPLCYRGEFIEAQGQCIPKDQVGGDLMDLVADGPEAIAYGSLAAFYGDQTGIVTYNRSGEPAGPYDRRM
jgi:hypothetical protein